MLGSVPPRLGLAVKQSGAREAGSAGVAGSRRPGRGVAPRALLPLAARRLDSRVWVSSRRSRTSDEGRGTGFPGSLPRPKLFLLAEGGRAEGGSAAGERGARVPPARGLRLG